MYGLVNKAIQDFTTTSLGSVAWERVRHRAKIQEHEFVSMSPYDDQITYRLVESAAVELGQPAAKVLELFGEFWITYSAQEGYGALMELWGESYPAFIQNLNGLHARLRFTFPELRPPEIRCTERSDSVLRVEYRSEREGLAPFVVGLLRGLGRRFQLQVEVKHLYGRDTHDHDAFEVYYAQG